MLVGGVNPPLVATLDVALALDPLVVAAVAAAPAFEAFAPLSPIGGGVAKATGADASGAGVADDRALNVVPVTGTVVVETLAGAIDPAAPDVPDALDGPAAPVVEVVLVLPEAVVRVRPLPLDDALDDAGALVAPEVTAVVCGPAESAVVVVFPVDGDPLAVPVDALADGDVPVVPVTEVVVVVPDGKPTLFPAAGVVLLVVDAFADTALAAADPDVLVCEDDVEAELPAVAPRATLVPLVA